MWQKEWWRYTSTISQREGGGTGTWSPKYRRQRGQHSGGTSQERKSGGKSMVVTEEATEEEVGWEVVTMGSIMADDEGVVRGLS